MERDVLEAAILKNTDLYCAACGQMMYAGASSVRCLNKHCVNYKIRYDFPRVSLRKVPTAYQR